VYLFRFYSGNSREKQDKANIDRCSAYLDFQFNISADPQAEYTAVAVASNASRTSKYWARQFSQLISEDFGIPIGGNNGVLIGGEYGKNETDLIYTQIPAVMILPLFISNPIHASWIKDKSIQFQIARNLAKSLYSTFPNGGTFALTATPYTLEEYELIKFVFGSEDPVNYAKMILRQTCIMMQSQVTSSIENYRTKLHTHRY
jgi:hypothetical protein